MYNNSQLDTLNSAVHILKSQCIMLDNVVHIIGAIINQE